jgi:hypothetical protein
VLYYISIYKSFQKFSPEDFLSLLNLKNFNLKIVSEFGTLSVGGPEQTKYCCFTYIKYNPKSSKKSLISSQRLHKKKRHNSHKKINSFPNKNCVCGKTRTHQVLAKIHFNFNMKNLKLESKSLLFRACFS